MLGREPLTDPEDNAVTPAQQRDARHLAGCLLQAQLALIGPPERRPIDTGDLILSGLRGLIARYGQPGLALAVRGWCDAVAEALPAGHPPVVAEPEEHTAPAPQWAADLLTAHLTGDQVMLYRLIGCLPADPVECALHLLSLVAVSLAVIDAPAPALPRAS